VHASILAEKVEKSPRLHMHVAACNLDSRTSHLVAMPSLLLVLPLFLYPSVVAFGDDARWVSPAGAVANGTFAAYRATFTAAGKCSPSNTTIQVAADTKFWVWVNGRQVVWEGGLKRGPMPGAGYYDVLDLSAAPWNAGSDNTVAVLSLFLGRRTVPASQTWWNNEHSDSGRHALLVDGTVCGTRLVTTAHGSSGSAATWRAVPHGGFSNDIESDMRQNFRFSDPDTVFNATASLALGNWTQPDFDDAAWPTVVELGRPGDGPWGALVERPIPQFSRSEHKQFTALRVETDAHDGDGYVRHASYKFPSILLCKALSRLGATEIRAEITR
jgi:alpha-L-rhamnosidase